MRALLAIVMLAAAFSAASVGAFKAISDRAERLDQIAAQEQMNRVAFSRRNGPRVAEGRE